MKNTQKNLDIKNIVFTFATEKTCNNNEERKSIDTQDSDKEQRMGHSGERRVPSLGSCRERLRPERLSEQIRRYYP